MEHHSQLNYTELSSGSLERKDIFIAPHKELKVTNT